MPAGQPQVAQLVGQGFAVAAHLQVHLAEVGQVGGNAVGSAVALLQAQGAHVGAHGGLVAALLGLGFGNVVDGPGHALPVAQRGPQPAAGFEVGNGLGQAATGSVHDAAQHVGFGQAAPGVQALAQGQGFGRQSQGAGGVAVAVFPNHLV